MTPPEPADPAAVVGRFNDCINRQDLYGLTDLMSADHTFVDSAGSTVTGRAGCADAWRGFFAAFPDYRNVFTTVSTRTDPVTGTDIVAVVGHSVCAEPALSGPALWTAVVHDGRVTEWRVHDDTADNRRRLSIAADR
jgi:ketosteroid isomerase-like protein